MGTIDVDAESASPEFSLRFKWLRCLNCDYDLNGLTLDRCPECGQGFDRDELRALSRCSKQPVHPWDDRRRIGLLRAFWGTCWAVWTNPRRFAQVLPLRPNLCSVWWLSLTCWGVAAVLLVVLAAVTGSIRESAPGIVFCISGVLVGVMTCEVVLAAGIDLVLQPTRGGKRDNYPFWRGLTHHGGTYVILLVMGFIGLAILGVTSTRLAYTAMSSVVELAAVLLSPGVALLWWRGTASMVLERGQGTRVQRIIAVLLIPIAGVIGVAIGAATGTLALLAVGGTL